MRRSVGLISFGLLAAGVLCGPAWGALPPYAQLPRTTTVAAGGGWTAWSEPVNGRWRLVLNSPADVSSRPKVATRGVPFDVDLGTDASGRPVLTYSRCRGREPSIDGGASAIAPNYATGVGCRLYALRPETGRERALRKAAGTMSEVLPSMARGRLAFVDARSVGSRRIAQLRVRAVNASSSTLLGAGTWRRASRGFAEGVTSVDTDGVHVAAVFRSRDEEFNSFDSILEVAPASGARRMYQVQYGSITEDCSYDTVLAPTVRAGAVTYLRSDGTSWQAERVSAARPAPGKPAGTTTYGYVQDGSGLAVKPSSAALDGDRLVVVGNVDPTPVFARTAISLFTPGPFTAGGRKLAC